MPAPRSCRASRGRLSAAGGQRGRRHRRRGRLPAAGVDVGAPAPRGARHRRRPLTGARRWACRDTASAVGGRVVLLVVDATSSRWPITVATARLREAGAQAVLPLVLHLRPYRIVSCGPGRCGPSARRRGPHPDGASVRYLSDQVVVSPSRVSRVADEFVGRGLLERAVSPQDGRLSLVRLTPAGREALGDQATFADALTTRFLSLLTPEQVLSLGAIAHRLGAPNCREISASAPAAGESSGGPLVDAPPPAPR